MLTDNLLSISFGAGEEAGAISYSPPASSAPPTPQDYLSFYQIDASITWDSSINSAPRIE